MANEDEDDDIKYMAVVNHEEQYSIWAAHRPLPSGWRPAGKDGTKKECLDWIGEVWTDMRPLSLRKSMEEYEERRRQGLLPEVEPQPVDTTPPLPERLSQGTHRIVSRRSKTAKELKEQIDRGYVLLTFAETRGGTELGSRLVPTHCDLSAADFELGRGSVHLVGELKLDSVPVRLIADLDVGTLTGQGHLEILNPATGAEAP